MGDTPTPTLPSPPSSTLLSFPAPTNPATSVSIRPEQPDQLATRPSSSPEIATRRGKITKKDRERWRKWREGQTDEEIASNERVSVLTVRASIQHFLAYQDSVSHEAVDMKANELAIHTLDQLKSVIDDVIVAEKDQTYTAEDGSEKVRQVPDLKMRLTAFDKITKLIQSVRKSENGITVNQNNIQNNVNLGGKRGLTMEERIRTLREKNQLKNDATILDAQLLDEEDDDDEEYEDEEDSELEDAEEEDEESKPEDPAQK